MRREESDCLLQNTLGHVEMKAEEDLTSELLPQSLCLYLSAWGSCPTVCPCSACGPPELVLCTH